MISRFLILALCALPIAAHAQDSLRISERVGHRLDANERAYFGVLPRLDPAATVWMQPHPDGAALVIAQPGRPDSVVALSSDERTVLARYLDAFETEGEALLRTLPSVPGRAVLAQLVRYRAPVQLNAPVTRMRLRSGETLRGRLLRAREGRVLFWPFDTMYDWRQAEAVRVFDLRDVAWVEARNVASRLQSGMAVGAGLAASAVSTAASEDQRVAGAIGLANAAALALDALFSRKSYAQVSLAAQAGSRLGFGDVVREREVFWLGVMPPELSSEAAPETVRWNAAAGVPRRAQRLRIMFSTPRRLAYHNEAGQLRYTQGTQTVVYTSPVRQTRPRNTLRIDAGYSPTPWLGVGALASFDAAFDRAIRPGEQRLRGREAYAYAEVFPLSSRTAKRLSVGVAAGAGRARYAARFFSGFDPTDLPAFYQTTLTPANDPTLGEQSALQVESFAAFARAAAAWQLTSHTALHLGVAYHHIPVRFEVPARSYIYQLGNGVTGVFFETPDLSARLSHTDVNVGVQLRF